MKVAPVTPRDVRSGMLRTRDSGPVQMYEDPYDPIISFSSPIAGFIYARDPEIPNYWVAVGKEAPSEESKATPPAQGRKKTRTRTKGSDDSVRTALYRLRNADGELLYVGISEKPPKRWGQHAADKEWWPEVAGLSLEWFDSRTEALAMEARAIQAEKPRHNVLHNQPSGG
ncbi:GIY-YIG nuclease family protein [Streptomyces sp. NPDC052000]|uniref:GIY-YIG nuclease family protein n=1 Tax=Streptomyces sp. NPDC052000 TaxID=3155676 RepID=UPI00344BDFE4